MRPRRRAAIGDDDRDQVVVPVRRVRDGRGGDSRLRHVTSYELHAVDFGSSADKVFASLDKHPFVAGEFVWTGFDYLGEPTPYYESRSSYTGIIDLAWGHRDAGTPDYIDDDLRPLILDSATAPDNDSWTFDKLLELDGSDATRIVERFGQMGVRKITFAA